MKKFEEVLSNDHQMSIAGPGLTEVPGLMLRRGLGLAGVSQVGCPGGWGWGRAPVHLGLMHHALWYHGESPMWTDCTKAFFP